MSIRPAGIPTTATARENQRVLWGRDGIIQDILNRFGSEKVEDYRPSGSFFRLIDGTRRVRAPIRQWLARLVIWYLAEAARDVDLNLGLTGSFRFCAWAAVARKA